MAYTCIENPPFVKNPNGGFFMEKRLKVFLACFLALLIALSVRLAYIQIVGGEELKEAASKQQRISLYGVDSRGTIYDRELVPLTGSTKEYIYIVTKDNVKGRSSDFMKLMDEMGAERIGTDSVKYYVYSVPLYDKRKTEQLVLEYGAFVFEDNRRYDDNQSAAHIIGYINTYDNEGINGVEYEFNDLLSMTQKKVYVYGDAAGNILQGSKSYMKTGKVTNGENVDIVLTIDIDLQQRVEEVLKETNHNAAAVVSFADTGEILAMASTPAYNPNLVGQYMGSSNSELVNKVTQGQYPPGSIFKIVVMAAALEYGITDANGVPIDLDTKFYCTGAEELYGIKIGCSTGGKDGHGEINLKDAFAKSCNCAFIQLGKQVGEENIIEMAKRFGFGQLPIKDIPNVNIGNVTKKENAQGAGIGNLSIGQGDMLVTPLQIARMTNIIAMNGTDIELSLIKNNEEIAQAASRISTEGQSYDIGKIANKYANRSIKTGVISEETAKTIKTAMEATATYGTAANADFLYSFGGKTGSAEDTVNGEETVHGWFTGYYPADNPKYSVTVFVENGKSGRASAVPIMENIIEGIEELD